MRGLLFTIALAVWLPALPAAAATGRVVKVLPHFLDLEGRHAISPSLYDRDAYQARLRKNPALRSALRFDVQWRAKGVKEQLKLRVELRGTAKGDLPRSMTLESELKPRRRTSGWASVPLAGEQYKNFGEVTAWRVTLWDGAQMVGEQTSFLW